MAKPGSGGTRERGSAGAPGCAAAGGRRALSTDECCRRVTFALPMSPLVLNFTESFDTEMRTVGGREGDHQRPSERADAETHYLRRRRLTCVANRREVLADALELPRVHLNGGSVLGVGDAEVLAVDVHELQLELGDALLLCAQGDSGSFRRGCCFLDEAFRSLRRSPRDRRAAEDAPALSNMKVTTSPVSSAFMVMMSSLSAHLSILLCDAADASTGRTCESPSASAHHLRAGAASRSLGRAAVVGRPVLARRN